MIPNLCLAFYGLAPQKPAFIENLLSNLLIKFKQLQYLGNKTWSTIDDA